MSEIEQTQNHEEEDVKKEEKIPEKKTEGVTEAEQNDASVADESAIADSSVNAEKSEDAEAGDDEESGSDSEESLPPGLLERPVEILEKKRERKKITRFTYDDDKSSPSVEKKVEIPKGNGIRLREHPRVEYQLDHNTAEDLKIIHRFFFGSTAPNHVVKKNLREFCGFVMDKDSPQYEKKEEFIGRFTVGNLKWAMMVCDVPKIVGKKEELIDAFMEWCLCPKPQDKPVPGKKVKKDSGDKKKRKKKTKRSAKKMENGNSTSDTTPAKKSKMSPVKRKKKPDKKSSDKKAKIKLTSPKTKPKVDSDLSDTSDDEPLQQKKKSPPTNGEIRKYIEGLLTNADLEIMTMKVVFQQVYEQYPDFDLTDRKSYIKETVKKIIS